MTGFLQLHILNVVSAFSSSPQGRVVSPTGVWDYAAATVSVAAVVIAAFFCIRYFFLPAGDEETHIKNTILEDINLTDEERPRG
jgi:hypothetical protein